MVGMRQTSRATRATVSTVVPAYSAERPERHRRHQEDDRQAGEQDRERDLVRRPLALRALDEGDHPVEEGLARVGRDADHEPVADERRAAGDRAPDVRARLLEDRGRLAGDRRLVDEADALDDVAVAGDRLAFLDDDDVALAQLGRADVLERPVGRAAVGGRLRARPAQGRRLGPAARLGDGLGVGREEDGEPQPDGDLDLEARGRPAPADRLEAGHVGERDERHQDRGDLDHEHHRVLDQAGAGRACGTPAGGPPGAGPDRGRRAAAAARPEGFAPPSVTKRWKRRVPRPKIDGLRRAHGSEDLSGVLEELLDDRPSARAGKKVSAPTMIDDADQQDAEQRRRSSGRCPSDGATRRLAAIEPARARIGTIIP